MKSRDNADIAARQMARTLVAAQDRIARQQIQDIKTSQLGVVTSASPLSIRAETYGVPITGPDCIVVGGVPLSKGDLVALTMTRSGTWVVASMNPPAAPLEASAGASAPVSSPAQSGIVSIDPSASPGERVIQAAQMASASAASATKFSIGPNDRASPDGGYAWANQLASVFGLKVTSTKRGSGRRTSSGGVSQHGTYGGAADISGGSSAQMRLALWAYNKGNSPFHQVIYSPWGQANDGKYQTPSSMHSQVRADHFDHVHLGFGVEFTYTPGGPVGKGLGAGEPVKGSDAQVKQWAQAAGYSSTPKSWAGVFVHHCFTEAGVDHGGVLSPPTAQGAIDKAKADGIIGEPVPGCIIVTGTISGTMIINPHMAIFVSGKRAAAKVIAGNVGASPGRVATRTIPLPRNGSWCIIPPGLKEG